MESVHSIGSHTVYSRNISPRSKLQSFCHIIDDIVVFLDGNKYNFIVTT